jgi:hypothetical protein
MRTTAVTEMENTVRKQVGIVFHIMAFSYPRFRKSMKLKELDECEQVAGWKTANDMAAI